MKKLLLLFALPLLALVAAAPYHNVKNLQLGYERVQHAYQEKENLLKAELLGKGITDTNFELYLRAFKNEGVLEAWVKPKGAQQFQLFKTYEICAVSGQLGPKRQGGDYQTPEGFYFIDRFNPQSKYYLSLGINYPNLADRRKSAASDLGGDIFIHGSCETAGCLPMTDEQIKEIYILSVEASHHGQAQIPVHIFPYRINEKIYNDAIFSSPRQLNEYEANLIKFWRNIGEGMRYFDTHKKLPAVSVDAAGNYQFN
jgi:murein L,D-transpeptidase YafK